MPGQRYDAVKKIFGRGEDSRRGSQLLHVHTWKFGMARCEVRFSGVAVTGKARWLTGSGRVAPKPRPRGVDCEVLVKRQEKCVGELAQRGVAETMKSIRERIKKLPPAVQQKRLAAAEQTEKQLRKIMRQQLVGSSALATCKRSNKWVGLSPGAKREAEGMRNCLKQADCAGFATCYWKLVGAKLVGGKPGR